MSDLDNVRELVDPGKAYFWMLILGVLIGRAWVELPDTVVRVVLDVIEIKLVALFVALALTLISVGVYFYTGRSDSDPDA